MLPHINAQNWDALRGGQALQRVDLRGSFVRSGMTHAK